MSTEHPQSESLSIPIVIFLLLYILTYYNYLVVVTCHPRASVYVRIESFLFFPKHAYRYLYKYVTCILLLILIRFYNIVMRVYRELTYLSSPAISRNTRDYYYTFSLKGEYFNYLYCTQ